MSRISANVPQLRSLGRVFDGTATDLVAVKTRLQLAKNATSLNTQHDPSVAQVAGLINAAGLGMTGVARDYGSSGELTDRSARQFALADGSAFSLNTLGAFSPGGPGGSGEHHPFSAISRAIDWINGNSYYGTTENSLNVKDIVQAAWGSRSWAQAHAVRDRQFERYSSSRSASSAWHKRTRKRLVARLDPTRRLVARSHSAFRDAVRSSRSTAGMSRLGALRSRALVGTQGARAFGSKALMRGLEATLSTQKSYSRLAHRAYGWRHSVTSWERDALPKLQRGQQAASRFGRQVANSRAMGPVRSAAGAIGRSSAAQRLASLARGATQVADRLKPAGRLLVRGTGHVRTFGAGAMRSAQGLRAVRAVAPVARVAGRVLGPAMVAFDGVSAVNHLAAGRNEEAAISGAKAVGGALLLAGGPVTAPVGAVILVGAYAYEHRETLKRWGNNAKDWTGRQMSRAGRAAKKQIVDTGKKVVETGRKVVESGKAVVDGGKKVLDAGKSIIKNPVKALGGLFG